MKKAVAFGMFIISLLLGASFVIIGTTTMTQSAVWLGMILIMLGTINLAIKVTVPEAKHVPRPVQPMPVKKTRKKSKKRRKK